MKFLANTIERNSEYVTPYAGVWIEMMIVELKKDMTTSLPTRECGLKFFEQVREISWQLSLPTRECGLKLKWNK